MATTSLTAQRHDPDDGWSLPAWLYADPEYFEVELKQIIRPAWQIVCHVSDIAAPGDWMGLDYAGENIVVLHGADDEIRAFHNVCRHRGARILDGSSGCAKRIVCPYHAWTYASDGRLVGVPSRESYDPTDLAGIGLVPVEHEIWEGFVFVRLESGGPSVARMMAPYAQEIGPYRFPELRKLGRVTLRHRTVNWKNIADNYSDGLHIAVAHPGLKRLVGDGYGVESTDWADKMWGPLVDRPSSNPSERAYAHFLPRVAHLPADRQRLWTYFKLWPNVAFDIYPDQVDFMQFLPISATETLIREISYAVPDPEASDDARRRMRAAQYLNWRINRQVNAEDTELVARVQQGMASSSFSVGPLSREEVALRNFARRVRALIPEARDHAAPPPGWSRAYR
ncbi:aromatic ring-hydroxylating oxygenase subunit alpha [Sphingomonas sp.]|uniref:aromatic ring-hydroxylating oxygenase subunit alpha n=1 Tax=Sphingomonas sp. TaxID=28214 RepID=UPI003B3A86E6